MMFSSHKTIQESMYKRLYKNNEWLKIGCMVPKISDDPDVRMCVSGILVEGSNPTDITVTKNLTSKSLKNISASDSPSLLFKPFKSSLYTEVGKFKSPTGLFTSRNTDLFHNPTALDTLLCEGESMFVWVACFDIDLLALVFSSKRVFSMSKRLILF